MAAGDANEGLEPGLCPARKTRNQHGSRRNGPLPPRDPHGAVYANRPKYRSTHGRGAADLALASARSPKVALGLDGISYLIAAKRYGIVTPLSLEYEEEIKKRSGAPNLEEALELTRAATAATSARERDG